MTTQTHEGDNRSKLEIATEAAIKAAVAIESTGKKWRAAIIALGAAAPSTEAAKTAICEVLKTAHATLTLGKTTDQCKQLGVYSTLRYAGQTAGRALDLGGYFAKAKGSDYEFRAYSVPKPKGSTAPAAANTAAEQSAPDNATTPELAALASPAKAPECPDDALALIEGKWTKDALLAAFVRRYPAELRAIAKETARLSAKKA